MRLEFIRLSLRSQGRNNSISKIYKGNIVARNMGIYKYIQQAWKKPKDNPMYRERLLAWRRENGVVKLECPTRLDRARSLGYQSKDGFTMVRVRVLRGGRKRELIKKGRRSKTRRRTKIVSKSYQSVAEERVARKYPNLEVLNSYYVAKDGKYYWYEVILVNPYSSSVKKDSKINWVCGRQHTNRALRGLTSSARKSRGLRKKGKGAEKIRPSLRANKRKSH
tara:strand:- start:288 stop:953 length:666 start_codon:yes stop_codon:yes gene_type:complete